MTTKMTTELRRCKGSARFDIEPHEAPTSEFPKQPSRKGGLGVMCKTHWTEYTRALHLAAKARQAAQTEGEAPAAVDALPGPEHVKRVGESDVQAALETLAAANGSGRETPLGEAIDGGTDEADAA